MAETQAGCVHRHTGHSPHGCAPPAQAPGWRSRPLGPPPFSGSACTRTRRGWHGGIGPRHYLAKPHVNERLAHGCACCATKGHRKSLLPPNTQQRGSHPSRLLKSHALAHTAAQLQPSLRSTQAGLRSTQPEKQPAQLGSLVLLPVNQLLVVKLVQALNDESSHLRLCGRVCRGHARQRPG